MKQFITSFRLARTLNCGIDTMSFPRNCGLRSYKIFSAGRPAEIERWLTSLHDELSDAERARRALIEGYPNESPALRSGVWNRSRLQSISSNVSFANSCAHSP